MQVNVEDVSALTKKMKIVLPKDYVEKKLDDAYQSLKSEVSLKGFRKGKIPRKVLEKNYRTKVEYDVAEKMIQDTYFDALEQQKVDAVVHPEIKSQKFEEDGTFAYEAEVDVKPQFELGEYKGVGIEQPEIVVSDAEVEGELEALRKQMAPLRSVEDRAIQLNDIAVIDFQGFHNGEPMKQVHGDNYSVDVGLGRNGKEFEEKLIGLKKGDDASHEIEFPPNFTNPVLSGKKVEFKVHVKDVKERVLADLDDEFAKDVGDEFNTLEEVKTHIRDKAVQGKEESQRGDLTDQVMLKILEAHDFEVPRRLVAYEINALVKELENNLERQGMTLESAGMNREALAEQYNEAAEKRVKGDFILKKVAEQEELKLDDEDVEKGFNRIAQQYQMPVSEVKKYFSNRDDLLPFMNELLNEKILKFLLDEAKIKKVPAESAEKSADKDLSKDE